MNLKQAIASGAFVLALAACGTVDNSHAQSQTQPQQDTPTPAASNSVPMRTFVCKNGLTVKIQQLSTEQIRLHVNRQAVVMDNAVTASGVRYTAKKGLFGGNTEWHEKSGDAVFDYAQMHGGQAETFCREQ